MIGWLMNEELSVEWEMTEETQVLGENPCQYQFVYHRSNILWHMRSNLGSRGWKQATNHSYHLHSYAIHEIITPQKWRHSDDLHFEAT
jgi:hypothetical protein